MTFGRAWRWREQEHHLSMAGLVSPEFLKVVKRHQHETFTYVIGANGKVKIGKTGDFRHRFAGLQASSPDALTVYAVVPDYVLTEEAAHERWKADRLHGEWFTKTPELDTWIVELRGLQERAERKLLHINRVLAIAGRRKRPLRKLLEWETWNKSKKETGPRYDACRLCSEVKPLRSTFDFPHFLCQSCRAWRNRMVKEGADAIEKPLIDAVDRAKAALARHWLRLHALQAITRSECDRGAL